MKRFFKRLSATLLLVATLSNGLTVFANELTIEDVVEDAIEYNEAEPRERIYVREPRANTAVSLEEILETAPLFDEVNGASDVQTRATKSFDLSLEQQISLIQQDEGLSDAQKQMAVERLSAGEVRTPRSYGNIWLGVSTARQPNGYYCGPATVFQQVAYLKGWSDTQTFYAGVPNRIPAEGTTTTMNKLDTDRVGSTPWDYVHRVLNWHNAKHWYNKTYVSNLSNFKAQVNSTLSKSAPVALLIRTTSSVFGYTSSGHYLTIAGQNTGASQYLIVDPNRSSSYYITDAQAYNAVSTKANIIYN